MEKLAGFVVIVWIYVDRAISAGPEYPGGGRGDVGDCKAGVAQGLGQPFGFARRVGGMEQLETLRRQIDHDSSWIGGLSRRAAQQNFKKTALAQVIFDFTKKY